MKSITEQEEEEHNKKRMIGACQANFSSVFLIHFRKLS